MSNMKNAILFLSIMLTSFLFVSCEDNDDLLSENTDDSEYDAEVLIQEGLPMDTTIYVNELDQNQDSVKLSVTFTSDDDKMRRVYMTENIAGAGSEIYELAGDPDTKGDGSLDIQSNKGYEVTYDISFPVLSNMDVGTVEYRLWTTHGRGDFRDSEKRLVAGPGTITIDYGGTNPNNADVKEYTAKLLAAPLASGESKTFISLANGEVYKINDGEEYAAYWDFGYYYGATHNASLASTFDYPSNIIDVVTIANTTSDELNHTYFQTSSQTATDFEEITYASDLDYITQPEDETITKLQVGDVIEFVDNYGKKGMIEVTEINGTDGEGDYIELNIKVQP